MYEETVTTGGNLCCGRPRSNGRAPSFCCLLCRGRIHSYLATLASDLQQAGRGEIAPEVNG